MRFAELDAVTVDAYGTTVRLLDPVPALERALSVRGTERSPEEIATAFAAEGAYYRPRSWQGRDEPSLGRLRQECTQVFLDALGVDVDPHQFAPEYIRALEFEPVPGAVEALRRLRARGLDLAVVANWDMGLHEQLAKLGLNTYFSAIVSSAEAGVVKPDPAIFDTALERLGVTRKRALHVGDDPVDEQGARAAGMHFAPTPLATAFQGWV